MVKPWLNQRKFTGKHVYTRLHPGFPVMFPEITPSHAKVIVKFSGSSSFPPWKKCRSPHLHKNPFSDTPIIHILGKVSQIVGKSKFNHIIILIMGFTPFKFLVNRVYSIQILGNSTNVLSDGPRTPVSWWINGWPKSRGSGPRIFRAMN